MAANRSATPADWDALRRDVKLGATPDIFLGGSIGQGWKKTVYGDKLRAMYTCEPPQRAAAYPDLLGALRGRRRCPRRRCAAHCPVYWR
jgi:hypothetical protein